MKIPNLVKTLIVFAAGVALIAAWSLPASGQPTNLPTTFNLSPSTPGAANGFQLPFGGTTQSACPSSLAGQARCLASVIDPSTLISRFLQFIFHPVSGSSPSATVAGLSPATLEGVYGFPANPGTTITSSTPGYGKTIGIVDAYDDSSAASDLSTFSTQWNLPQLTDSTSTSCAGGCFIKVNQTGGSSYPQANSGWGLEISLDIEWAHAVAPGANVLLVEANSSSFSDLLTAEQYAAAHATYVSNSWGGSDSTGESSYDSDFTASGVSYFAASGDTGGQVLYPSSSPNVLAVGGTSLSFNGNGTFASESAWSSGGGGCSTNETAPSTQSSFSQYANVGCGGERSTPDVALDADPNSGVAVYDSNPSYRGWIVVGGTSVATPIWASESAVQGLSFASGSSTGSGLANIYETPTPTFRDITAGSDGHPSLVGYDLTTGRGSWAMSAPDWPTGSTDPLALTGSTSSSSTAQVGLTWSSVSGATSYDIFRGTSSGGESTTPYATVSGPSYTDTGVSAGVTYYYEVAAVNTVGGGGLGTPSSQVSGTPSSNNPTPAPAASFTTSCNGATCKFTSTSTGTITAYSWSATNNGSGTASTFSDTFRSAGTYTVSLTVTGSSNQVSTASTAVPCTSRRSFFGSSLTCS